MNLASKVVCAIACLAAIGCGDDDPAAIRKDFAEFWADSSTYCGKVADECGQTSHAECASDWPTASEVAAAIDLAKLDSDDLARCESAGRAEDTCYRKLPCAALSAEEVPCEKEDQRVQLDCASLLTALDFPDTGGASTGGAGNGSAGDDKASSAQPASGGNIGKELCNRAIECSTEPVGAMDLATCIEQVNQSFASILPDPHATVECLKRADCASLQQEGETVTRDCIDIDPDATQCIDAQTLHICNNDGACRNVKCADSCKLLSATPVGCGLNPTDGYDKCQCALE